MHKLITTAIMLLFNLVTICSYGFILTQSLPKNERPKLIINNPTDENSLFWVQYHNAESVHEVDWKIESHSQLSLDFSEWNPDKNPFSIKSFDENLKVYLEFSNQRQVLLSSDAGLKFKNKPNSKEYINKIHILNLHSAKQEINLLLDRKKSFKIQSGNYYDTLSVEIPESVNIEVSAKGRFLVLLETRSNFLVAKKELTSPNESEIPIAGQFFLVGTDNLQDSFVVHLTDPEQIKEARKTLQEKSAKILVADIDANISPWNRAFIGPQSIPWSWSVKKVHSFSDLALMECDGSASFVEERLLSWLNASRICFWRSHIIKELNRSELKSARIEQ